MAPEECQELCVSLFLCEGFERTRREDRHRKTVKRVLIVQMSCVVFFDFAVGVKARVCVRHNDPFLETVSAYSTVRTERYSSTSSQLFLVYILQVLFRALSVV